MKLSQVVFVSYQANGLFDVTAPKTYGGAEVQLYLLAQALAESKRCQVRFITATAAPISTQVIDGITVERRWFFATQPTIRNIWHWLRTLWSSLRSSHGDIFVQRALGSETAIVALYSWLHRKKFVYMVAHEWDTSGQFEREHGVMGKIIVYAMRRAHPIIVQTEQQQTDLKTVYRRTAELFPTVYPMTTTPLTRTQRTAILWVGRAEPWKQPHLVLELAGLLPHKQFTLIMPPGNDPQYYETLVKTASKLSNVTFIPQVAFNDIDHYFHTAILFVNTSQQEGFPNTFIQAAKNGTPVISLVVNPNSILTTHQFGFVANGSVEQLNQYVQQLLSDPVLYERYSAQAYRYALTYHNIATRGQDFLQLITSN